MRPGIQGRRGGRSDAGRLCGLHERRIHHGSYHDVGCGSYDAGRGGRPGCAASAGLPQHDPPGAAVGGGDDDRIRLGSEVVYDTAGHIVTNAHVVGTATSFQVFLAGSASPCRPG
jgi:S1-C subfamily serine protease